MKKEPLLNAKQYLLLFVLGVTGILLSYFYLDIPIALWSFSLETFWHTAFAKISNTGKGTVLIFSAALGWMIFRKRAMKLSSSFHFLFLSLLFSEVVVKSLKFIFGRMRPSELRDADQYGFMFFQTSSSFHSFPSGHTTLAFALFAVLSTLLPKYSFLWLCFALTMAFARIGVSAHFLSDTIAGMLTGIGSVLLVHLFMQKKEWNSWEKPV